MTNRTSSQAVKSELASNMVNGHLSFKVLSVTPGHREGQNYYVVAVPKAVMRSGFFGWISQATISEWGKPTRFGNDLFRLANRVTGVELILENDYPHVVQVVTSAELEASAPPEHFQDLVKMMPAVVCEAIEEAALRNNGLGQRFAEWLRRLF
jgi:hypothetical protein